MRNKSILVFLLGLSCLIAWFHFSSGSDGGSDGRASQTRTGAISLAGGVEGRATLESLKDLGIHSIPGVEFNDPGLNAHPHVEADGMAAYEVSDDTENAKLVLGADHLGVIWYHSEFRDGTHEELRRWHRYVANALDSVKSGSGVLPQ